ncbi:ABC transporter E family member 2 isoform X1 [Brachypodium distachyon]|uniref:ABC transporter E family member 2 isoform X1 n=1 Tax=Brachypodium distachyon TaxID=15368 RepID=UPI0001C73BD7|nr:ABC transporter E family member 2 isoform X1 [Brachypodium distachyon]XP_014756954.1 ABC transporter E family member 2 isoform X1 [Brachypodium distachyon]|eukprot:XP_003572083.1 ABC transporter E family member 2 isoform X1 [Brachypodium distachyon]
MATTRIAILNEDRCKPKKCRQECKKSCPVVKTGKHCIEVNPTSKSAFISEELCIGCGICVKKCPFDAIQIINLPKDLDKDTTHRYGANTFKLHRLPVPRPGQVLGLIGANGIGKSTALKVLQGKIKPNLGRFKNPPDWQEILTYFRGSELQNYFTRMLEDNLKAIIKRQDVERIPEKVQGNVGKLLERLDQRGMIDQLCIDLELNQLLDRNIQDLSGGELQRFAIAGIAAQSAEIYMFDEPSVYLDVKQRLKAAQVIRSLLRTNSYVIVVEHDLSVLDYMSDFICCLYGKPGAYGVVTLPFSVREGINVFLAGFVPTENLRFRNESLTFKIAEVQENAEEIETYQRYKYPTMTKTYDNFKLTVMEGEFTDSQIVVMLGENGTGKTTFIKMLAGLEKPDTVEGTDTEIPKFYVSHKPQKLKPKFQGTVRQLLHLKIRDSYTYPQFTSDVMKPLQIEQLMDQEIINLSGGERQRVALCLCLGKPADIYLIDEPSASLDSEQRIVASKVIKRFILHAKKTAFVVEHDFIMATYLADKVVVFEGRPSVDCTANAPQSLQSGMNKFLSHLDITFRRDPTNYRPRINKLGSTKDREQKSEGSYYYL